MSKHDHNDIPPELERYLALCKRVYDRMEASGEWPWEDDWRQAPDSQECRDMVESEDNSDV